MARKKKTAASRKNGKAKTVAPNDRKAMYEEEMLDKARQVGGLAASALMLMNHVATTYRADDVTQTLAAGFAEALSVVLPSAGKGT